MQFVGAGIGFFAALNHGLWLRYGYEREGVESPLAIIAGRVEEVEKQGLDMMKGSGGEKLDLNLGENEKGGRNQNMDRK